ncbi:hypothetical protein [Ruegeria arenilitoris]|uniref:hypothetical protein n=1 Tax=Ruegeria arenilitoris TaxID=1173585 RepID=UPI00147C6CCB|nr:hypothetical protein [Ruegeria arenilitoris]
MSEVLAAIFGALIGSIIGPIVLDEYRSWKRRSEWTEPRKKLLKSMLEDPERTFKSLERLSRTIGCSEDDTRTLLIELGARGANLASGKEAWALIERAPLAEELRKNDHKNAGEDQR